MSYLIARQLDAELSTLDSAEDRQSAPEFSVIHETETYVDRAVLESVGRVCLS